MISPQKLETWEPSHDFFTEENQKIMSRWPIPGPFGCIFKQKSLARSSSDRVVNGRRKTEG